MFLPFLRKVINQTLRTNDLFQICKMMEHILVSQIMKHLQSYNILSEVQYKFRPHHFCEAQLLLTTKLMTWSMPLIISYRRTRPSLTFRKLSTRWHILYRLINKLEFFGIRGDILSWIISFPSNHTQQVVVSGKQLLFCSVSSGLPQGSVLRHVLFLLYINDTYNIRYSKPGTFIHR